MKIASRASASQGFADKGLNSGALQTAKDNARRDVMNIGLYGGISAIAASMGGAGIVALLGMAVVARHCFSLAGNMLKAGHAAPKPGAQPTP